jgi:hypothetical protein
MEQLLLYTQPALIVGADQLIALVDRVIERHPRKRAEEPKRRPLFAWLRKVPATHADMAPRRT